MTLTSNDILCFKTKWKDRSMIHSKPLSNEEINDSQVKADQEIFIGLLDEILTPIDAHLISSPHVFTTDKDGCNETEDMVEPLTTTPYDKETLDQQNKEVRGNLVEGSDTLIGAEIYLAHGDRNEIAKVIKRKRDKNQFRLFCNIINHRMSKGVVDKDDQCRVSKVNDTRNGL